MKVYVVYADVYRRILGTSWERNTMLFGVYCSKEKADARKENLMEEHKYLVGVKEVNIDSECSACLSSFLE